MSPSVNSRSFHTREFAESDLYSLGQNPDQPQDERMLTIGMLTLRKVSPFKLSRRQTESLAGFMSRPWPKKGEQVAEAFRDEDWTQYKSEFLCSPASMDMALGLMTVIGAWAGAIKAKLNTLQSAKSMGIHLLQFSWAVSSRDLSRQMEFQALELKGWVLDELFKAYHKGEEGALESGVACPLRRDELEESYWQAYMNSISRWAKEQVISVDNAEFRIAPTFSGGTSLLPSNLTDAVSNLRKRVSVTASSIGQNFSSVSQTRAAERLELERQRMEALVLVDSDLVELKRIQSLRSEPGSQDTSVRPPNPSEYAQTQVGYQSTAGDRQSLDQALWRVDVVETRTREEASASIPSTPTANSDTEPNGLGIPHISSWDLKHGINPHVW